MHDREHDMTRDGFMTLGSTLYDNAGCKKTETPFAPPENCHFFFNPHGQTILST